MRRSSRWGVLSLVAVLVISVAGFAVRWSPGELDLIQDPGSQETYRLILQNDSDSPVELKIYVADWIRDANGVNDFGVPTNGARWRLDRSFPAGDTLEIRYTVQLPSSYAVDVEGTFRTWGPQVTGDIEGASTVAPEMVDTETASTPRGLPTITRSVESVDAAGIATVVLTVRTPVAFEGLTIEEVYAERVEMESLSAAGGSFDTVNRSNASWITLSHDQITLQAEESREILMTVQTPETFSGMTWSIIHAESRRVSVGGVSGAQIVAVPTVGLKVLVTAPGTETATGEVRGVQVVGASPLTVAAEFANTGNVQLVVTGEVQVIAQTGDVVRSFPFAEHGRDYFRVLPGTERTVEIIDMSGEPVLSEGIYQAVVSFDFGGESVVVGARGFRIR